MKRRRNRHLSRQRAALALLAVVLIALGVLGLLLSTGTIEALTNWAVSDETLVNANVDDTVSSDQFAYQVGAFAAGVVLFALGGIWLRSQIPARRHHQDQEFANDVPSDVEDERVAGLNTVRGGALAGALEEDLEQHPGVDRAIAEFRSEEGLIRLRLTTSDSLGLSELRSEIIGPAVERASTVGEFPDTPRVETDVRFTEQSRTVA